MFLQENSKQRWGHTGDHTYQAAKALDFDCTSNTSSTACDDSNSNFGASEMSTEPGNNILGPTTRRQWTEWVKRPNSGSESQNDNDSSVCGAFFLNLMQTLALQKKTMIQT